MSRIQILVGDCIEQMKTMESDSVHCCVTSPPYWALRDYGVDGQLGLEPTLEEHLEKMVEVFEEVRRILRPDGTLWLNYGDSYAASVNGRSAADTKAAGNDDRTFRDKPFGTVQGVLKPKDLCMIPSRLAIALQEAGWWVRSEIVWEKPNPMPESCQDRPTQSYEKVFLLTKSARYYYDADAIREEHSTPELERSNKHGASAMRGQEAIRPRGNLEATDDAETRYYHPKGRNSRNVWKIATKAFRDAHFATFPPALAERCIKAGCPVDGVVFDPFGGAGTTGLVADRLQRRSILIELNPDYAQMAKRRIEGDAPLFAEVAA